MLQKQRALLLHPDFNVHTRFPVSPFRPVGDVNIFTFLLDITVRVAQPNTWSYVQVQWDVSHAQSYVNSSLCGSTESGYDAAEGTGWGSASTDINLDLSVASSQSNQTSGEAGASSGSSDSLLIGAWRGAPDGTGEDWLGGYFMGLLDNLEVCMALNLNQFLLA